MRVGLIVGTQVDIISRVLQASARSLPGAGSSSSNTIDKPSAGLRAGETDVAFVVLPMHEEDLSFMPLERPGVVATLFDQHPLSDRSSVSIGEILEEPWVSTDTPDEICRGYWLAASHRTVPPVVHHRVRTMDKFIQLVAAAEAVGIAPAWVERNYQGRPVRFIPVIDVESPTVALAWREGEDASRRSSACAVLPGPHWIPPATCDPYGTRAPSRTAHETRPSRPGPCLAPRAELLGDPMTRFPRDRVTP